jgi:hypothetical protein
VDVVREGQRYPVERVTVADIETTTVVGIQFGVEVGYKLTPRDDGSCSTGCPAR